MTSSRPILNIDLNIIAHNYNYLSTFCNNADVAAVVKADCYNLGAKQIVPVLYKQGCRHFFVANYEEGISVRSISGDINIYVLNGLFADETNILTEYNLIPVLHSYAQILLWQEHANKLNRKLPCIIKVDIGMKRLGMSAQDFKQFLDSAFKKNLDILYLMSHLTSSEQKDNIANKLQLERFNQFVPMLPNIKKSLANSGGIFLGKEYHFDLVRPGAALYGICYDYIIDIKCPITLYAPIIHMHELLPGESLGYNGRYINNTPHTILTATLSIGYVDGFLPTLINKAILYIDGVQVPIIGKISMDLSVIDVSAIAKEKLFLGQYVEIIGPNSKIRDLSNAAGTTEYEFLINLGHRFKRIYIG